MISTLLPTLALAHPAAPPTTDPWPLTNIALVISGVLLGAAVLLGVYRVYRGPQLPDRVVALDLLGTLCVGVCVMVAIAAAEVANLLVAMVMALLLFVSTLAASHYLLSTLADRRASAADGEPADDQLAKDHPAGDKSAEELDKTPPEVRA